MATVEEDFRVILGVLEATLSDLDQRLRLHLASWDGEAAAAYREFFTTWHSTARDMAGELARLHTAIQTAHRNYRSAKAAHTRMWTL